MPAEVVRAATVDLTLSGQRIVRAYAVCARRDRKLPPTLGGLADRLDASQSGRQSWGRGRHQAQSHFLWQKVLSAGARGAAVTAWERESTRADRHRVQASAGMWVHEGTLHRRGLANRRTYGIAMRMRFGLDVRPALGEPAEIQCGHTKAGGVQCTANLDSFGHHAAACGKGGGFVERHDCIVEELGARLKSMGLKVAVERWVDDVVESRSGGRSRRARMDLVVQSARGTDYLDVTCFHPFTATGLTRPPSSGGRDP